MEINNTAELVVGEAGSPLFLVTKAKNQFLMHREMFPDKTVGSNCGISWAWEPLARPALVYLDPE